MTRLRAFLLLIFPLSLLFSCKGKQADIILINGIFHTVNDKDEIAQAVAISDGKIQAVGTTDDILFEFSCDSIVDLQGKIVFPGFIDAHCHFYNYSLSLNQVDLFGARSFEEVVAITDSFFRNTETEWIQGRGWDQNLWQGQAFPRNTLLNEQWPDKPVLLMRVDGHAAIANDEALRRAGITADTRVNGGKVVMYNGKPSGLLIDNAVDLVSGVIPPPSPAEREKALLRGQQNCFAVGLTTLDDAGLNKDEILFLDSLHRAGALQMRIYAMANTNEENFDYWLGKGIYQTDYLNVRSFKMLADGALGSRGACLLESYKDDPGNRGFLLKKPGFFRTTAAKMKEKGFQLNTHCIGDSANRLMLHIYGEALKDTNDLRWRIEHCQVIDTTDFVLFKKYSVIPSVQPTHATSDMPWAEDRIGKERLKGAYSYKTLLNTTGWIANGSDFPVEKINPLLGFYAAVERKDATGFPLDGFLPEQCLTRREALRGMTIWAAKANFEEDIKGSIEAGKWADFVILDRNIMTCEPKEMLETRVLQTWVGGKRVYQAP